MILNAKELWKELSKVAHFDDTAYDEDLKNSIRTCLHLESDNIADELEKLHISTDKLLLAVLKAMKPFSQMMLDLLRMYEIAEAKSNNNNIEMIFDFDSEQLNFTLDTFREAVVNIQMQLKQRTVLVDPMELITFTQSLDSFFVSPLTRYIGTDEEFIVNSQLSQEVLEWLNDYYERDILPEHLPTFPLTSNDKLNIELKRLADLAEESFQLYYRAYHPEEGMCKSILKAADLYGTVFWKAETERWLGKFVKIFYMVNKNLNGAQWDNINNVINRINVFFNTSEAIKTITKEEQKIEICEILSLPFWKFRHEMYSVWVFRCITNSISDFGLFYNVQNNSLVFKSGGPMLAKVCLPNMDFEIWAEKKHPAKGIELTGKGREKNIQPDYTIIKKVNDEDSNCILIECKQYKKPDYRNFANAVNDYSKVCSEACVFLVNYGLISNNIINRLTPEVWQRYKGYSYMRPEKPDKHRFEQDIRDYLTVIWSSYQTNQLKNLINWEYRPNSLKIELSWGRKPLDLDLEVKGRMPSGDFIIDYEHKGSLNKYPFAELNQDMRKGPGQETVTIKKFISGCYEIFVHNYSEEKEIIGEVNLKIINGKQVINLKKVNLWKENNSWYIGTLNAIGFICTDEWLNHNCIGIF